MNEYNNPSFATVFERAYFCGLVQETVLRPVVCRVHIIVPPLLSRYSDRLRAGRQRRGRSSSPGMVENFRFSIASRPALEPTLAHIQWVPETDLLKGKAAGA
jgi:hypothetical protein